MSSYQRRDPLLLSRSGEIALAAAGAGAAVLALAAAAGLGAAAAVFGGGWVWPGDSAGVVAVVVGLLVGEPGRGLSPAAAARVPGSAAVYSSVAVAEVLTLAAAGWLAMVAARYHRPGDARGGMATRGEAARVLGIRRLRSAAAVIRPDLYAGTGPGPATPTAADSSGAVRLWLRSRRPGGDRRGL